jgi:RHS repeat-associated protein
MKTRAGGCHGPRVNFMQHVASSRSRLNPSSRAGCVDDGKFHAEASLYYYRARYYDPTLGRFLSEDPWKFFAGDANFYSYVFESPTNFTDPSGLKCWCTFSQSTGHLRCIDDVTGRRIADADGYAGNGPGRNNPDLQDVPFVGPIPTGVYDMLPAWNSPTTGPITIPLRYRGPRGEFPPNRSPDMFRIHPANPAHPDDSSKGCIIANKNARKKIADQCGGTGSLTVVP